MSDENNKKAVPETIVSRISKEELGVKITEFMKFLEDQRVIGVIVCVTSDGAAIGSNVPHEISQSVLAAGTAALLAPDGPKLTGFGATVPNAINPNLN